MASINDLDNPLLVLILNRLCIQKLFTAGRVCVRWNEIRGLSARDRKELVLMIGNDAKRYIDESVFQIPKRSEFVDDNGVAMFPDQSDVQLQIHSFPLQFSRFLYAQFGNLTSLTISCRAHYKELDPIIHLLVQFSRPDGPLQSLKLYSNQDNESNTELNKSQNIRAYRRLLSTVNSIGSLRKLTFDVNTKFVRNYRFPQIDLPILDQLEELEFNSADEQFACLHDSITRYALNNRRLRRIANMAPSGSLGFVALVLVLFLITTFPFSSSSKQTGIYANNRTFDIGGSEQTPSHLRSTVKDNCTLYITPVSVYDREQFGLLVAITRHDLHRFANYSCDVDCASRWIQLCGFIFDREVNCRSINKQNCTDYAYPVKEDDLANLSYHYSVDCGRGDRSVCSWAAYQPENSRPDYYALMVIKWVDGMKQVEQYRSGGSLYCYNLPTEFIKSRREEFNATIMHSFRQNIEVGWYFEHFILANFLKPFCGHKAVLHSNPYTFRYFVINFNVKKYFFTQSKVESTRRYMFSSCPAYGTQFDTIFSDDDNTDDDSNERMPHESYLKTSMIVPGLMQSYVSLVLDNDIRVYENGDNMTILSGDAFKWIFDDFMMMVQRNPDYNSSVRSINRKILFYLLVPQMQQHYMQAQKKKKPKKKQKKKKKMEHELPGKEVVQVEKGKKSHKTFGPYFGSYITVGLCILLVVLSVLFYLYYSSGSKKTEDSSGPTEL